MLDKEQVINFFDKCAAGWDADMVRNDRIIDTILDNTCVEKGKKVLDVACGTGVLIPDYLKREAAYVKGIDISPQMIQIAKGKFKEPSVSFECCDAENAEFTEMFDVIVVYNAFPHFSDPDKLIENMAAHLVNGGYFTVAHGMSRERIDAHHRGCASSVSNGLMEAEELSKLFEKHLEVTEVISNDEMFQVVGRKCL